MRILLLVGAVIILGLGFAATRMLDRDSGFAFLLGALQLGGGLAISACFSVRWKWQGLAAGGVLALLGFARGLGNLPSLAKYLANPGASPLPLLETSVTAICLFLLAATVRALLAERRRQLLEKLATEEA